MPGFGAERFWGIASPLLPFRDHGPVGKDTGLYEVSQDLTLFLRRVYALEGRRRNIIDFDLAPPDPRVDSGWNKFIITPPNRQERLIITKGLEELLGKVEQLSLPENSREKSQYDYLKAKLQAHIAYYRDTVSGDETPTLVLIEATLGKKPEIIPDPILEAQLELVQRLSEESGVKSPVALDEVREKIASRIPQLLNALSTFLGRKVTPNITLEVVQEDDYWVNWSSGTHSNFVQRVNTHRRHALRWTEGKIGAMVVHEDTGHMAQMASWQKEIDEQRLLPVLGVTSVYDPEQITCEGIAQTMHHFVPEIRLLLSPHEELELELEGLRQMVYNNVHIWVNSADVPEEDIIAEVHKYCPAEPESEIRRQMRDREHDPIKRLYLYAYGIGFRLHRWYAQNLNTEGKKRFLEFIFSQPTTPKQEYEYFLALVNDPRGSYGSLKVPYNPTGDLRPFD